jgi:hypothetical protein
MSRNSNKTRSFPCVLKTIIRDAIDENKITLNDKQIRSRLRARFRDVHILNTSWIAMSSRDYDAIRSTFDVAYANKIANARKRNTKTRVKPIVENA